MSSYIPPSIRTIRQDIQQSAVLSGGQVLPAFVGTAFPTQKGVSGKQFSLGASAVFSIPSLGALGPIAAITQIRSQSSGGLIYNSADFTFDPVGQTITWQSVSLASPYIVSATVTTGGTLAAGNYYYVLTATKTLNITGPVLGETAAGNQITAVVPSGGAGKNVLVWQPVPGAEGYKLYRSQATGDFTGNCLLATISGGYTTSFTDDGSLSPSTGSPPGLATNGQVTCTNSAPYVLTPGQTLNVKLNGASALIATFNATQGNLTDGATYPVTLGASTTLLVKIDGGPTQTIVFAGTETAAADVAGTINAQLTGGSATVTTGHVVIKSDRKGTGSIVNVTGGTANATLNYSTSPNNGTGNVSNISAVTNAEVVAVLNAVINTGSTGGTATTAANNKVTVSANTAGAGGSVQFDPGVTGGTANAAIGFDTASYAGSSASSASALRRPALNGTVNSTQDKFYVDYVYTATNFFVVQSFTNITLALASVGVGSNLAIAILLAMGTSGQGNNASQVLAMSIPDDTLATYQAAFNILGTRKDIDLVVPCNSAFNVSNALQAAVDFNSSTDQMRERLGVVGVPKGTPVGDTQTAATAVFLANQMSDERMIIVYPWPFMDVQAQDLSISNLEMDGWASAAAYAGLMAALPDRAEPATTKKIQGLTALGGTELDETTMNILGGAGVTVLEVEDGNIIVRDSLTTDTTDQPGMNPSIILTEDFLRKNLRSNFKNFRGRKLLPNLLNQITNRTNKLLASMVKLGLIVSYDPQSISAAQNPDLLTEVLVTFQYRPVFPLRIITFSYSFELTPITLAA